MARTLAVVLDGRKAIWGWFWDVGITSVLRRYRVGARVGLGKTRRAGHRGDDLDAGADLSNTLLITATETGSVLHLPLDPRQAGVLAVLVLVVFLSSVAFLAMSRDGKVKEWHEGWTLTALGGFAALLAPIWLGLILYVLWSFVKLVASFPDITDGENVRWHIATFLGLITALGALLGTPLAIIRVFTTERQTKASEEGLVTDRISKAVEGLGAEKEVNRLGRNVRYDLGSDRVALFEWQDAQPTIPEDATDREFGDWKNVSQTEPNLAVRIGAIYALERISQDSPRDHVQIMEILCAYIRENAPASGAEAFPEPEWKPLADEADEDARAEHLAARAERFGTYWFESKAWKWAQSLKPRTDIQVATQVIGRRTKAQVAAERTDLRHGAEGYLLDLHGTNLQGVDMSRVDLRKAQLLGARMEGANLSNAKLEMADLRGTRLDGAQLTYAWMEGAHLRMARMEGAELRGARMERADLYFARMEGADFGEARMEGAHLYGAQMEGACLRHARMAGANIRDARISGIDFTGARMEGANFFQVTTDEKTNFHAAAAEYAAMKTVNLENANLSQDQVNSLFGDGSVILPDGIERPAHWPVEKLGLSEFEAKWRDWQAKTGYVPPAKAE